MALVMPMTSDAFVLIAVAGAGAAAAAIDLRTRRVPNALTAGIAATGLLLAVAGIGRVAVTAAVGGCLVGVLLMLPGHIFGSTGGGDVKLLGSLGTMLGPTGIFTAFLAMAVVGGLMALAITVHRHRIGQTDNRFAYAPAIAVGACVAVIGG
jgi:prepilin peptidase CpaA